MPSLAVGVSLTLKDVVPGECAHNTILSQYDENQMYHWSRGRKLLSIHAALVGIGWFVVALPSLLAVQASEAVQDWFGDLAPATQGFFGVIVILSAIPLLWPIYLAIGWYEIQVATGSSSKTAVGAAGRRLLAVQAAMALAASTGLMALAIAMRGVPGSEYLTLAWVPLAAVAAAHFWTMRRLTR